jgi:hypothetical protein
MNFHYQKGSSHHSAARSSKSLVEGMNARAGCNTYDGRNRLAYEGVTRKGVQHAQYEHNPVAALRPGKSDSSNEVGQQKSLLSKKRSTKETDRKTCFSG